MVDPRTQRLLLAAAVGLLVALPASADGPAPPPDETAPAELTSEVVLIVKVTGDGSDAHLEVPLPVDDDHQEVLHEEFRLRGFEKEEVERDGNRFAVLTYPKLEGRKRFTYKARVRTRALREDAPSPPLGTPAPRALARWTVPTPRIQSRSPLVRERLIRHVEPRLEAGERDIVRLIYGFVSRQFERRTGKAGTSNVLKAVRTGMADDRGLHRLFVTFLRAAGVPSRTVGGLELERTGKRKFTRWSEAWLGGQWVPFSVPDGWYGTLPASVLKLYHGARPLVERSGVVGVSFKVIVRDPRPAPVEPAQGQASAAAAGREVVEP